MQKVLSCQRHQPYDFFGKINNFWKQWVKSFWLNVLKNRFGQYLWSKYWIRSTIFAINSLSIHSLAIKISCYQPPVLSKYLLSNSFTINSVVITFICYQASFVIQPQLLSTHLLSSLNCYQASFAIKPHLLCSLNFYRHIYFQASLANRPTCHQSSVAINNFAFNHHLP